MSISKRIKALALAAPFAAAMLVPASAQAHVDFFVGLGGYPPPVYYAPPPPVYYGPPAVYYGPPARYYEAPPVYYEPGWRWRHHHRWHDDDD